jgi:hypothetical protein
LMPNGALELHVKVFQGIQFFKNKMYRIPSNSRARGHPVLYYRKPTLRLGSGMPSFLFFFCQAAVVHSYVTDCPRLSAYRQWTTPRTSSSVSCVSPHVSWYQNRTASTLLQEEDSHLPVQFLA